MSSYCFISCKYSQRKSRCKVCKPVRGHVSFRISCCTFPLWFKGRMFNGIFPQAILTLKKRSLGNLKWAFLPGILQAHLQSGHSSSCCGPLHILRARKQVFLQCQVHPGRLRKDAQARLYPGLLLPDQYLIQLFGSQSWFINRKQTFPHLSSLNKAQWMGNRSWGSLNK